MAVYWTLFFGFLVLLISYLLWVPVVLYLNTITDQYYLKVKGLVRVGVEQDPDQWVRIVIRLLFLRFTIYPLRRKDSGRARDSGEAPRGKKRKKMNFKKAIRLLKSFKVRRFWLDIDTGNCMTNARLFPAFALLNHRGGNFHVNFQGRNQLVLELQNRPIYIIKSFINL